MRLNDPSPPPVCLDSTKIRLERLRVTETFQFIPTGTRAGRWGWVRSNASVRELAGRRRASPGTAQTHEGWKSQLDTQSVCPSPVMMVSPFGIAHIFHTPSSPVVTRICLRGWSARLEGGGQRGGQHGGQRRGHV